MHEILFSGLIHWNRGYYSELRNNFEKTTRVAFSYVHIGRSKENPSFRSIAFYCMQFLDMGKYMGNARR